MATNQDRAMHRAAIYASTRGHSRASTRNQLDVAQNHADEIGLEVVREYVDLRGERTQLLRMVADTTAADPPFRKVLVSELSRISRRADELNQCWTTLASNGVELLSAAQSEAGAVGTTIEQYLRSQHSSRVRHGMRAAAQRGFYVFSQAPYGYRKVAVRDQGIRRYKLELDPPVSGTVRRIFDLRLEGATELEIAAELNASRARAPTISRWNTRNVRRILSNEVYCGTAVAAKQDMANPETAVRVPNTFPAIVTQHEFDQVQRMV